MENTKGKISAFQFFIMLFLSRLLTTVTYVSSYTKDVRLSDMLIQPIFRIIMGTVIMFPVFMLYKRYSDKNVLDLARERSTKLSKALAVIYVITFFYFTVVTNARLDLFAGTVVFPETDVDYMLIFVILFCCYGAALGFEALARTSVLSAVLVIPAIIFILAALVNKIDLLNLTPLFYNGVTPVLKTALDSEGQTVEYAIIAMLLPCVNGKAKKGFFFWLVAETLIMAVMFFFAATVMGNYTGTQLFPFHTLTSLAKFTMFDRLDALFTGVWIMCAFIKAVLLIWLQADIIKSEFPKLKITHILISIGTLAIIANLIISGGIQRFNIIDNSVIKIILTGITAFIIPLIILIFHRRERSKV